LKSLVYTNLFFATVAVSCKALRKGFLNGTCIAKIVSLVKKPTIVDIKTIFLFSFPFEKGMTDRMPVKGNRLDSGPSLVAETLP